MPCHLIVGRHRAVFFLRREEEDKQRHYCYQASGFGEKGYAAPCVLATALENTTLEPKQGNKFIENGQLYILHNGVKYNVLGTEIK